MKDEVRNERLQNVHRSSFILHPFKRLLTSGFYAIIFPEPPQISPSFNEASLNQDVTNCPACARRTPAARAACMYCGTALAVSKIETAPAQRVLESHERAFNVVIEPQFSRLDENTVPRFAAALQIELPEAQAYVTANKRLPIARCQNHQEAELIAALVRTCGLGCVVVPDEVLRLDWELIRARKIVVVGENLSVRHSGGEVVVPLPDIRLMVLGSLKNTQVHYAEASGLVKNSGSVLDTSEFRSDETMMDVYTANLHTSFRIKADGFDYSGLIWPLAFRVELNFQAAVKGLLGDAKNASFDADFARIRGLLSRPWPERSRTEAKGLKRSGLGIKAVKQSRVISDNRDQFDRYSRLMFLAVEEA
jgi:hypothetical protein